MGLTFRQIYALEERYWDRMQWNIELQVKLNPFGGGEDPQIEDENADLRAIFNQKPIDVTTDAGSAYITDKLGIKIKERPRRG